MAGAAVPAIIEAAGSVATAGMDWKSQMMTNAWNAKQAEINRDFQERMSNTSYQRAVQDLKAAGLNPALAYSQGGESSPSGSFASAAGTPHPGEAILSGLKTFAERKLNAASAKRADEEAKLAHYNAKAAKRDYNIDSLNADVPPGTHLVMDSDGDIEPDIRGGVRAVQRRGEASYSAARAGKEGAQASLYRDLAGILHPWTGMSARGMQALQDLLTNDNRGSITDLPGIIGSAIRGFFQDLNNKDRIRTNKLRRALITKAPPTSGPRLRSH